MVKLHKLNMCIKIRCFGGDKLSDKKVEIPEKMYEKIQNKIEGTSFENISEYVTYVLREVLGDEEEEQEFTEDDEKKVKERLKALGYMD